MEDGRNPRAASRCSCDLPGHDKWGEGAFSFGLHPKHPVSDVTPQSRSPGPDPCSKQKGKFRWFSPGRGPRVLRLHLQKLPPHFARLSAPGVGVGGGGLGFGILRKRRVHTVPRGREWENLQKRRGLSNEGFILKGENWEPFRRGRTGGWGEA